MMLQNVVTTHATITDSLPADLRDRACRDQDSFNQFRLVVNVYIAFPLCLLGITGNLLSFAALRLDPSLSYSASLLLRAMTVSDNLYLVASLFALTLQTVCHATDWVRGLEFVYPSLQRYVWPAASFAQTTTIWLLTIVTILRQALCASTGHIFVTFCI